MRQPGRPELLVCAALSIFTGDLARGQDALPPGVEQILPRGRIAAIFAPQFVPAAGAKIPEEAWVLGVEFAGEPRAYGLNLLNHHEVVNDRIGETAFAAVW